MERPIAHSFLIGSFQRANHIRVLIWLYPEYIVQYTNVTGIGKRASTAVCRKEPFFLHFSPSKILLTIFAGKEKSSRNFLS